MALKDFCFTLVYDSAYKDRGRVFTAVGDYIKMRLLSVEYGTGVREVGVGVFLRELGGPIRRRRKPKYNRERRTSLLGHELEDTLEFYLYPSLDAVRSAASVGNLIETLRTALAREADAVRALHIPDFDTPKFLQDLDAQLQLLERSPSLWARLGGGQFALPPSAEIQGASPMGASEEAVVPRTDIDAFPSAALAFVECELPFVRLAAERKDRAALGPLVERVNKFLQPWAGIMATQGGVLKTFEDCGYLVADLGREIAIECDQNVTVAERERLHLEFQERLERCRACAERIERNRHRAG